MVTQLYPTSDAMRSSIIVTLFLVFIFIQVCRIDSGKCPDAFGVKAVMICPTSKEKYEEASLKKQCSQLASKYNCTAANGFYYHCVINSFRNNSFEACAPEKNIFGYCTEYNDGAGIIQSQPSAGCNKTGFPKCDAAYKSWQSYMYEGCYELVNKATTHSTTGQTDSEISATTGSTEIDSNSDKTAIWAPILAVIFLFAIGCGIMYMRRRKKICRGKHLNKKSLEETDEETKKFIPKPTEISRGKHLNEYGSGKNDETEKITLQPTDKTVTLINEADAATATDIYSFAARKSEGDLSKENNVESEKYLTYYTSIDRYFVETNTYVKGEEMFHKYGIVIWKGRPGCGKTLAAIHLILKQKMREDSNWTFRKIRSFEELSFIECDTNTLIFIDNIFFTKSSESDLKKWWDKLSNIYERYFESENEYPVRFVITARENAVERVCSLMEKMNVTPILRENVRMDANVLTVDEKLKILEKQIQFAKEKRHAVIPKMDDSFWSKVKKSEGPIGFPLCAHLFVCSQEYRKSGVNFFSRPIEYLKRQINVEIERDKSNRTKSLFFVLFFYEWHTKLGFSETLQIKNEYQCRKFLDNISKDLLTNFEPFDFKGLVTEAQRLVGAFLKAESDDNFRFVHDSVYEAVGAWFCETYIVQTAKYFPLEILQNQEFANAEDDKEAQGILATRLLYETLHQRISKVFACKCFERESFCKCFMTELQGKDSKTKLDFVSVTNESSPVKLPCIFWTSCNKLTYLTEQLYDIVKNKCVNLNSDYHLFVSLYGECCAREEGLLLTVNGMLRDNFEEIKKRVLRFRDDEGNSILHLVITSEKTDQFASDVVQKLLTEKCKDLNLSVELRNKSKITPLMLAVCQAIKRTKVIETLMEFQPKLQLKDATNSNVFHHCLASCNDDETCSEYLKIILQGQNAETCLTKDDSKGNTPLCIAAMETTCSRILSIITLLERGSNQIIKTINEDGLSPLQLAIRSFKEKKSTLAELECCVRVILLLSFGGSPDNTSDKNDQAITECKSDLLRSILKKPNDERNMINVLESILGKVGKCENVTEQVMTESKKIGTNLRLCINKAGQILKNCRLDMLE